MNGQAKHFYTFGPFVLDAAQHVVLSMTALALGEILICLWLLIKGAKPESQDQHSPHKVGD